MEYQPLSPQEREEIFSRQILPGFLLDVVPQEHPTVIILGGQPGAGKTRLIELLKLERPNFIAINGDEFRNFHPLYDQLVESGEEDMSDRTQPEVNYWVERLIDTVAERKGNMIIEGTMRRLEVVEKTARQLSERGYTVEADILVVPKEVSEASIFYRYETQKKELQNARFVKPESHDNSVIGIRETLKGITQTKLSRIRLHSRHDEEYSDEYEISREGNNWSEGETPAEAFDKILSRGLTEGEIQYILNLWNETEDLARERNTEGEYRKLIENHKAEIQKLKNPELNKNRLR